MTSCQLVSLTTRISAANKSTGNSSEFDEGPFLIDVDRGGCYVGAWDILKHPFSCLT